MINIEISSDESSVYEEKLQLSEKGKLMA